eukprot:gene9455-19637_t
MFNVLETYDIKSVSVLNMILFSGAILLGLEILSRIVPFLFKNFPRIPIKGKHLDELEQLDKSFIFINKLMTIVFVYHLWIVVHSTPSIKWRWDETNVFNTILSFIGFYAFYDLLYMLFHRALHIRSIYGYIHKHHHRQKAPSRGNTDAINVHPLEFMVGEYLHLLTIYIIPCHIYAVIIFILAGGVLASLNHTRYDVDIPGVFSAKIHDVHHRMPERNYGQYTMYWDKIFGTYRPYLDTDTDKSIQYFAKNFSGRIRLRPRHDCVLDFVIFPITLWNDLSIDSSRSESSPI